MPMLSRIAINAQTENGSSITAAANSVTRHDNNTGGTILLRGIISSEPGHFLQHLNVQRTIILPLRQDGKDYTGTLTFSASKPVEIVLGYRYKEIWKSLPP